MTPDTESVALWVIGRPTVERAALIAALRSQGVEVLPLDFPTSGAQSPPTGAGLSGLAANLGAALREVLDGVDITGLEAQMARAHSAPSGVIYLEADVAQRVRPAVFARLGASRELAVEPHLAMDPQFAAEGLEVVSARESGGVLSGQGEAARALPDDRAHLAVATHGMDVGWIDRLLLQLSIASIDEHAWVFLPSGDPSVDDHLKRRAEFYGLTGQRPGFGSDLDGWIRGAEAVVGRPSERQAVAALSSGVPLLLVGEIDKRTGLGWSVEQGLSSHARTPVEVSVALEACLEGPRPNRVEFGGADRCATALLRRLRGVRPSETRSGDPGGEETLEIIGVTPGDSPQSDPEHERLEIDDALAKLKQRMGIDDGEG